MNIKSGVKVKGISPEITLAIFIVGEAYVRYGFTCTVTSVLDGKHSTKSLHYTGYAVDIRTKNVPERLQAAIRAEIAANLGDEYDVVLESDHIHIEFDPKTGAIV